MISCERNPLTKLHSDELNRWLAKGEYEVLRRILTARAKEFLAKAVNTQSTTGKYPLKEGEAIIAMEASQRYQTCLDVLAEIKQEDEHYTVILT